MYRTLTALMSALRTVGAVLVICGLGMLLAAPAAADDGAEEPGLPSPFCSYCTQAMNCFHANGCYCPPYDNTTCKPVLESETDCECR